MKSFAPGRRMRETKNAKTFSTFAQWILDLQFLAKGEKIE